MYTNSKKIFNMDQNKILEFISLYKNFEFLWNLKHKNYYNKTMRENAWIEMSLKLHIPVPDLKHKMKNLMGTFRSEKSREKKGRCTKSGGESAYESRWFAYKYLEFLSDKEVPRETLDTSLNQVLIKEYKEEEDESIISLASTSTDAIVDTAGDDPFLIATPSIIDVQSLSKTTSKRKKIDDQDPSFIDDELQILHSDTSGQNDPYFIYGVHIANELRKYDSRTLAFVKKAFADILFEADMGRYKSNPVYFSDTSRDIQNSPLQYISSANHSPQEHIHDSSVNKPFGSSELGETFN